VGPQVSVEHEVARDLLRRGLLAAPFLVAGAAAGWGGRGAASAALALAVVLANFAAAAGLATWAGRRSAGLVGAAALVGYPLRMALVAAVVLAVRRAPWVEPAVLGVSLVVTHLALLAWEVPRVSLSLAFPALSPPARSRP
jgi:hypothetical protein